MSRRPGCTQRTLAESPVGFVELCSCGSVHVGVGPITMRIDIGAFERFAAMVEEARRKLQHATVSPEAAARWMRVPHDAT